MREGSICCEGQVGYLSNFNGLYSKFIPVVPVILYLGM
jgi:hypothetical protein